MPLFLLNYWKQIVGVLLLIASFGWGYYEGFQTEQSKFENFKMSLKVREAEVSANQAAITSQVEKEYSSQSQKNSQQVKTIVKEIPKYVYMDKGCTIPNSFVSMWDAINGLQIPPTSAEVDGTPSDVKLSQVLRAKADDTDKFYQCYHQLKSLQSWVNQESEVK